MELDGKVVLITGAGGGIGAATAVLAAQQGAQLALVDSDSTALAAIHSTLETQGSPVFSVVANVTQAEEVQSYVERVVDKYGRIDCFFNNAGISGPINSLCDTSDDDFENVIAVNQRGVFLGLKHVLRQMLKQGGGSIVNTGSIASERGMPLTVSYNAAKHAVVGLTRTAGAEYGSENIRVNAVLPGMVETRMLRAILDEIFEGDTEKGLAVAGSGSPLGRTGRPEEIAEVVLFLLSDRASFVNCAAWAVDGGFLGTGENGG